MNETIKSIADRCSCRDFASTPLTDGQIKTIVDSALSAPSARNLMPWQLIIVTDKALIEEMDVEGMRIMAAAEDKSAYDRVMSRGGKLFYNAPCMVMVPSDGSHYAGVDCGILIQNVALTAHALGLGSVICGMAGIPLSGPHGAEYKKRMQFRDGFDFCIAALVGVPNSLKEPHEHDTSKVTYIRP